MEAALMMEKKRNWIGGSAWRRRCCHLELDKTPLRKTRSRSYLHCGALMPLDMEESWMVPRENAHGAARIYILEVELDLDVSSIIIPNPSLDVASQMGQGRPKIYPKSIEEIGPKLMQIGSTKILEYKKIIKSYSKICRSMVA
ncbi:hypothetical protein VNO77_19232 [Canavalia gladiata]|uniref:Uncharacterized protein n=1 Tax=Canavalia gladiata TaxID=3824 RepID=A0AAN9QPE9_CANGL